MTTQSHVERDAIDPVPFIRWDDDAEMAGEYETRRGTVVVRHGRFRGGPSDDVEVVTIDSGEAVVWVLPTRGMSIWKIEAGGIRFGWDSPVAGPVHPHHVPLHDASGLGWLEGFDELLVRCGLESNGAPQFDDQGRLEYPLHGRIANLSAGSLSLEIDAVSGRVELSGTVIESRLFFKRLRMQSRIRMTAGSPVVDVLDDVTNDLSQPATMQLLYHVNVGEPILGEGSVLEASIESIAPRDASAEAAIDDWPTCSHPISGFSEQVYFADDKRTDDGWSVAMLRTSEDDAGLAVHYGASNLPCLQFWKNTAALSDGYVVGIEPATGRPLTRREEESAGRLVKLEPGETKSFRMKIIPMTDAEAVGQMRQKIESIQGDHRVEIRPL